MAFKGTRDAQLPADQPRRRAARRRRQRAHRQGPHRVPHARPRARRADVRRACSATSCSTSSFPEAELERERQVHPARVHRGRGRRAVDRRTSCSTALLRRPSGRPAGDRQPAERSSTSAAPSCSTTSRASTPAPTSSSASPADSTSTRFVAAAEAAFGGDAARARETRSSRRPTSAASRRGVQPGYSQTHVVLGFPIASLRDDHHAGMVAAALFGEGMSSPLMDEIRERRGLVYYASCSADVDELCGQFVVEASTSPAQLDEFLAEVRRLLAGARRNASTPTISSARSSQIAVRTLRAQERPVRRLEDAALDLFVARPRPLARARRSRGSRRSAPTTSATSSRACWRRRSRSRSPAASRRARSSARASTSPGPPTASVGTVSSFPLH